MRAPITLGYFVRLFALYSGAALLTGVFVVLGALIYAYPLLIAMFVGGMASGALFAALKRKVRMLRPALDAVFSPFHRHA